jgi:hypothetical protein
VKNLKVVDEKFFAKKIFYDLLFDFKIKNELAIDYIRSRLAIKGRFRELSALKKVLRVNGLKLNNNFEIRFVV